MDVSTEPAYVFAQLAGACLAAGVFRLRYGLAGDLGVSWPRTDTATAVVVEVAVSAFLMLVIL